MISCRIALSRLLFTLTVLACAEARDPSQEQNATPASPVLQASGLEQPKELDTTSNRNSPIKDADKVIVSLRGKFRDCYRAGLNIDPEMQGRVVVAATVEPSGNVGVTSIASNTGLSASVASCIAEVVQHAHFDPPGGTDSNLRVPVTFRKEN
jgi:hypothetical protein